jgi:hypothetical protein
MFFGEIVLLFGIPLLSSSQMHIHLQADTCLCEICIATLGPSWNFSQSEILVSLSLKDGLQSGINIGHRASHPASHPPKLKSGISQQHWSDF